MFVTVIFHTFFCQIITTYQYVKCLVKEIRFEKFVFILKRLIEKKIKIKCRATANPDFQENCIFGGFRLRGIFFVCDQKVDKIFKILDFLTFEGIAQSCDRTGFGRISMSNFQWYAWEHVKINIFLCI